LEPSGPDVRLLNVGSSRYADTAPQSAKRSLVNELNADCLALPPDHFAKFSSTRVGNQRDLEPAWQKVYNFDKSSAPDRDRLLRRHSWFVRPWAVIHADWQRRRRTSRLTFLRLSPCNVTHPLDRQSANAVADTEPPFRARSCPEQRYRHHELPVPSLRSTRSAMPCPI